MRMNALGHPLLIAIQRRNFHTLLAPLMRADDAQQLAQAGHGMDFFLRCACLRRAPSLAASQPHIRRAAQVDPVIRLKRQQHHREHAGALRLRLAMLVKNRAKICGRAVFAGRCAPLAAAPISPFFYPFVQPPL